MTRKRATPIGTNSNKEAKLDDKIQSAEPPLRASIEEAMRNFSSILSPSSLLAEVNPFFLQCPFNFGSTATGDKKPRLLAIDCISPLKQCFFRDPSNGILYPTEKPLSFYLPSYRDESKHYSLIHIARNTLNMNNFSDIDNERERESDSVMEDDSGCKEKYAELVAKNAVLIER